MDIQRNKNSLVAIDDTGELNIETRDETIFCKIALFVEEKILEETVSSTCEFANLANEKYPELNIQVSFSEDRRSAKFSMAIPTPSPGFDIESYFLDLIQKKLTSYASVYEASIPIMI